jgi:hypothetical protein
LAILFVLGNQAFATENAIDVVPAGTLLLPYFEVDLSNPAGRTTLFSVNNASAAPQLAHITFWTDQSRPTLDFTIYLTGYDVWTVNLGPLFRNGTIPLLINPPRIGGPKQAPAGVDEDAGAFSLNTGPAVVAGEGAACTFPLPTSLPPAFLTFIQRVHTGLTAPAGFLEAGRCGAAVFGDNVARGYMTIDVVRNCSPLTPNSPGYFSTILAGADPDPIGLPTATANVIWGDWFIVDPANDFAQGDTLVHIEAYRDPFTDETTNGYTFYGRYNGFSGIDNREPLATVWGVRYSVGGAFDATDLLCWRDTGAPESAVYYNALASGVCPGRPPASGLGADGQPLGNNQLVIFDEEENPITIEQPPFSPTPVGQTLSPCPWESNRTRVGGLQLPVAPFEFGWLYLNLNTENPFSDFPDDTLQSWVGVLFQASGRFSVGMQGMHFDHASDPRDLCIGLRGAVTECTID